MAFVHQGPRKSRFRNETHAGTSANGATADDARQSQARGRSTRPTQIDPKASASVSSVASSSARLDESDWSVVFPGRVKSDANADDVGTLRHSASSATLAPLHDGTGQFSTPELSITEEYDLQFGDEEGDDGQREDSAESITSSLERPPSLLGSTASSSDSGSPHVLTRPSRRLSSSASSDASGTSDSVVSIHPAESASLSEANSPHWSWSWEQADHRRILSSTTPRAVTPISSFAQLNDEGSGVIDTDNSDDESENEGGAPAPRDMDASFEDALESNPSALSAGLLPRTRTRRRHPMAAAVQVATSSVAASSSVVSSGVKRRHRKQAGSVRSGKSFRSADARGPLRSRRGEGGTRVEAHPPTTSSKDTKTQKVARLLGRMFDVDGDVLDAVVHDRGPLTLTKEEQEEGLTQQPISFGFSHDAVEIGEAMPASVHVRKGWRELIDGRIVEDDEGREDEEMERQEVDISLSSSRDVQTDVAAAAESIGSPSMTLQEAVSQALSQWSQHSAQNTISTTAAAEALKGVLPYFVPFSWRLLMRWVRDWNERSQGEQGELKKQDSTDPDLMDPASTDSSFVSTLPQSDVPSSRGRSRERKALSSSPI